MKKRVKWILAGVLALVAAGGGAAATLAPLSAGLTAISPGAVEVTFTEQGSYVYDREFQVYPLISGEVLEVRVREGDAVGQGDILAVVAAHDVEAQITSLESAISGYNAQISNVYSQEQAEKDALRLTRSSLEGQLLTLEAEIQREADYGETREYLIALQEEIVYQDIKNAQYAKGDMKDARELYDDGVLTMEEFNIYRQYQAGAEKQLAASRQLLEEMKADEPPEEVYQAQRQSIQAQIDSIDRRLDTSYGWAMAQYYQAQMQGAEENLEQMNSRLGKAHVTAAVDGVITSLPAHGSNLATQSAALAVIGADPVVEVFVPTREIDGVQPGDRVRLTAEKRAGDEILSGTVLSVDDKAEIQLSALGVEERRVRVLVRPDETDLRIGYDLDVTFTVHREESGIVVPKTAVFQQDGSHWVWAVRGGKAELQPVTRGMELREGYLIEEGLSGGDTVVSDANLQGLRRGRRVSAG